MSAIAHSMTVNTGAVTMSQTKQLRPELEDIVNDLVALKLMAKDGVLTHYAQRELVKPLCARDLADVAKAVSLALKRETQPIYNRPASVEGKQ